MFGNKRRRAASNPPLNGSTANPSAATAAAQAFLKNQVSNASLSSAAAAAALRSRPTTPISVADVQTKRMIRRSGSTSSVGSSVAGSSRPPLERRGSSGSMSERTFREPSPSRGVPSAPDAPPVPAIPNNISQSKPHRRATSMEAPPMRVLSPPPNKANGRGSSLGPGTTSTPPRHTGQRMSNLSNVHGLTGIERPESRGSVNFSYPTSSRPTSPVNQQRLTSPSRLRTNAPRINSSTNQNLVYDPNTRSFLPYAEILAIEQRIQDAANQTVKKTKKRFAPAQATGTHLADGTVGGRPRGTAVDAMDAAREARKAERPEKINAPAHTPRLEPISIPLTESSTVPTSSTNIPPQQSMAKKKKKRVAMTNESDSDQASYAPNSSDNDSDFRPAAYKTRAGTQLAKKPSIVREDREAEEEEEYKPGDLQNGLSSDTVARTTSPSPLPRSSAGMGHGRGQASASAAYAQERQHTRSASQPAPAPPVSTPNGSEVRGSRVQSVSPARTTHFASSPDNLVVKHQPPPRSISPRKSALKHSSSPMRGSSPAGEMTGTYGPSKRLSVSEASNDGSEDLPIPRKKAFRVSFDESNVMVGEAAPQASTDSPIAPSPQQAVRGWFSLGRGKKKDTSLLEDDDDEVMKPRPALPSFGSVRERKTTREPLEERQLVKPAEPVETTDSDAPATGTPASIPIAQASPVFTSPTGGVNEFPMGQSNDHVVGAIISQDAASKNAANISKSREPLPPQVLSVEGSGYHSDTDSTVSVLDNLATSDLGAIIASGNALNFEAGQLELHKAPEDNDVEPTSPRINGEIPEISFTQPTPILEAADERREWPDMPGGFPDTSSNSDSGSQTEDMPLPIAEHHATDPTPAGLGIAEPYEGLQPGSRALGEIATDNHKRHSTIDEETEDESIYSDAAEDFSDTEGDGFMSLNAVVESPVAPSAVPSHILSTPPDSPTAKSTKEAAYKKSQLSKKSSEPELDQGWEKAQEYWRGLSAEKKSKLEREAREEAEDSDATIEAVPLPMPKKKKKKVATRPAPVEIAPKQQPVQHDRTYMIQPGAKVGQDGSHPVIRSSMRAQPLHSPPETHIRKSMRGQGSMRASLRGSDDFETRGALQKTQRPVSLPAQIKADPASVRMHVKALSAASAALAPSTAQKDMVSPKPALRRKGSGDSDSSFKRTRPAEGSHFRSSMRRGSVDKTVDGRQQSPMRSGRFSMRSLSPTESTGGRLPFNNPQPLSQTHMRSSMRSSYDSAPTLRGNKPERAKSPIRIPGFGRSSSAKPIKQQPIRQRASRFADSSDEDEGPSAFRSRFVDSSDDDDEPVLKSGAMRSSMRANQPVRSIPHPAGVNDGDSSDLPDSDDEKSPSSPGIKLAKTRPNGNPNSNQGLNLASGSLRRSGSGRGTLASPMTDVTNSTPRPKQNRRGSFMSILRRKKADPTSKVRKSDIESAARRDTPLERSRSDLQALKRGESYQSTNGVSQPSTPKLQKRNNSGSWPLPVDDGSTKTAGGMDGRRFSADGGDSLAEGELTNGKGEGIARPELGTRRFTATGLSAVDLSTVTGKGRKKKKFQKLRNLFGLDD